MRDFALNCGRCLPVLVSCMQNQWRSLHFNWISWRKSRNCQIDQRYRDSLFPSGI